VQLLDQHILKNKFLVDYDATLANTFQEQIDACNKKFNTSYTYDMFTTWRSEDVLTKEEAEYIWGSEVFFSEDFQIKVEPVKGAVQGLRDLLDMGYECMVVSDRPKELFEVTRDWLDRQGFDTVRLLFTRHKASMAVDKSGAMTKSQAAWVHKLTAVWDDAPHHAETLSQREWIQRVYMLDNPHNHHINMPKVIRVDSWQDGIEHLKENPLEAPSWTTWEKEVA
jgi:uncharacterized HAD superfamily protein